MRKVVEGYSTTVMPVGSKALAADPEVSCGPSTIRNELAVLEELGLLAHPHTSAGRAPTDELWDQYHRPSRDQLARVYARYDY